MPRFLDEGRYVTDLECECTGSHGSYWWRGDKERQHCVACDGWLSPERLIEKANEVEEKG